MTDEDEKFLQRLRDFKECHTLRYATIDFLYWYEVQNRVSIILQKFITLISEPEEARRSKDFKLRLDQVELIAQAIYDITGCEKVSNVAFFALVDDFITAFTSILSCKVIGVEKSLVAILDTIDAIFLLSLQQKTPLKFGYRLK